MPGIGHFLSACYAYVIRDLLDIAHIIVRLLSSLFGMILYCPEVTSDWLVSPKQNLWRTIYPRAGLMVDSSWVAFNYSWPWPWPWIGSYGIRSCISHRPLSTHQISLKSEKPFCGWTNRTNRRDRTKFKVTWQKLGWISKIRPDKI